jgi:hypothetical protein
MESRAFIKEAKILMDDITEFSNENGLSQEDMQLKGNALQKRVNGMFVGLMNPSLPSVGRLRDVAIKAGFEVRIKNELSQQISFFENLQG